MAYAMVAIGVVGFVVWAHHMFTVGMSGEHAALTSSRRRWSSPCRRASRSSPGSPPCGAAPSTFKHADDLFAVGFIFLFTLGGVTGVVSWPMPASTSCAARHLLRRRALPLRAVARRRVCHLRRLSTTGSAKMSGRHVSARWMGKLHFWLFFIGVNLDVLPACTSSACRACRAAIPDYPDAFPRLELRRLDRLVHFGPQRPGLPVSSIFRTLSSGAKKRVAGDNPWGPKARRPSNGRCRLRRRSTQFEDPS